MILNNGAAHENYGQASKMNLDIILTRWIVLDRECLLRCGKTFRMLTTENILMAFLNSPAKMEIGLINNNKS